MDDILQAVAKQAPSLGVLCFLTIAFLRHLRSRDSELRGIAEDRRALIDGMTRMMDHSTQVIERNSQVIGAVVETIRKCNGPR